MVKVSLSYLVHLFTISGVVFSFLALIFAIDQNIPAVFFFLALALFVDGIDGTLARAANVKVHTPNINGEILNIASGKPIKIKNVILKICNIVGYGNPQFGKIKFRKDEILRLFPSITKVKKILKWKPVVDINLGLKKTIKYYKSN